MPEPVRIPFVLTAGAILLAAVVTTACETLGDGKCFGGDCVTAVGSTVSAKAVSVKSYLDTHPQARTALRLLRIAACTARPDTPLICASGPVIDKLREIREDVAAATVTGAAIDESDQLIADELGLLLDDAVAVANDLANTESEAAAAE